MEMEVEVDEVNVRPVILRELFEERLLGE